MNDAVIKDLYIGYGFNDIANIGFLRVTGESLYIEEVLVNIREYAFRNSMFSGNLKFLSTLVSIENQAFNNFGFSVTFDLADTHSLQTT